MDLVTLLAAAEAGHETSKTAFYVCGGALAVWAVVVSVIGFTRPGFPGTASAQRAVIAFSALLVVGATSTAVITG
jgi:hypothetical protein